MTRQSKHSRFRFLFRKFIFPWIFISQSVFAQSADRDFRQYQQSYFDQARSFFEKLNPFKNPNEFKDSQDVKNYINQLPGDKYGYQIQENSNEIHVIDLAKNNEVVSRIPISTREEVLKFRPSKMKDRLRQMSKNVYAAGAQGAKHTIVNLPMEAAIFYMAIGSVSAFYLFNNIGQSPASLKMFHDQQFSGVGITSLTMFLVSQGVTANVARLFLKNPKWHVMLPYLGMTVGSVVQNYTTSLMSDPNIKACVGEWFGGTKKGEGAAENPCDKAYDYFTLQKPWEYAPGITSLLVTTVIASSTQFAASKVVLAAAKRVSGDAVKTGLIRFAGILNPGAVPYLTATGIWIYLTKASNLAYFVALDHKINHAVTFAVKNLQESVSLPLVNSVKKTSDRLTKLLINEKRNNWSVERNEKSCRQFKNGDCSGFYEELEKFQEQMKMWRLANISEVIESHSSWQTYMGDLISRYSVSKEFYEKFIDEAKKFKSNPDREEIFLNRIYPLWGIVTERTKALDETFYTDPHLPESEQLQLVLGVKDEILSKFENRKDLSRDEVSLARSLSQFFKNNSGQTEIDKVKLAKGLIELKNWLSWQESRGADNSESPSIYYSDTSMNKADYYSVMQIFKKLGDP